MSWPDAEVHVDAALVQRLVRTQFPELAELDCVQAAEGFDNSLWRVGDDLVARIPRREMAVHAMRNELRWLPVMARHVSLHTPLPLRPGRPSGGYPWPWSISSWIDGVPGDEVDLDASGGSPRALATFLKELHVEAPVDAPENPWRSVTLASRSSFFGDRVQQLSDVVDGASLLKLYEDSARAPQWPEAKRWLHGDFHPGNTLYRGDALVGVVDFGDLCAGDPATDVAGALMSLPYDALGEFFTVYSVDDATLRRTMGWAAIFGTMMVSLGLHARSSYLRVGQRSLENALRLSAALSSM